MNRNQSILYNIAKQEFKDQMDPTDLSRAFYVNPHGDVLGFTIVRSNGKSLDYDAIENQYSYHTKDEPSQFDNLPEESFMNLVPYEYRQDQTGERQLHETHAFPDLSTTRIYETLRLMREDAGETQFSIALAMTDLPRSLLKDNELSAIASKAVLMYTNSSYNITLHEITAAITELLIQDASSLNTKTTLLTSDQNHFNTLVAKQAEARKREGDTL